MNRKVRVKSHERDGSKVSAHTREIASKPASSGASNRSPLTDTISDTYYIKVTDKDPDEKNNVGMLYSESVDNPANIKLVKFDSLPRTIEFIRFMKNRRNHFYKFEVVRSPLAGRKYSYEVGKYSVLPRDVRERHLGIRS